MRIANGAVPRWSPDGQRIGFLGDLRPHPTRDGVEMADLFLVDPNGENESRLTTVGNVDDFEWSPDGFQIALTTNEGSFNSMIIMNRDGSEATDITAGLDAQSYRWPRWRPGVAPSR